MADLKVSIGADLSEYKAGMQEAGNIAKTASSDISSSLTNAAAATDKMSGSAMSASMRFQQMRSGMSAMRDGTLAFVVGGQRADLMLMAMGHHINSLVNETGSLSGAMKALGSSVVGVGGVILAITLAFELYQHATKKAKEETVDYVKTLDSVSQASLKGQQNGVEEIVRLKVLYDATQNHLLALKDRNLAYDELEKKYPKFFTNADREKTLLGQNAAAYNTLRDAILSAAMAKAAEDQISTNANRQLENEKKITDLKNKQAKAATELATAQKDLKDSNKYIGIAGGSTGGVSTDTADEAKVTSRQEKVRDLQKQINNLLTDSNKLFEQNQALAGSAATYEEKAGYKTDPGSTDPTKKAKEAKTELQQLEEQLKKLQSAEDDLILKGHVPDLLEPTKLEHSIIQITALIAHVKELNSEIGNFHGEATSLKFTDNKGADAIANVGITSVPLEKGNVADIQAMAKAYIELNQEKTASEILDKRFKEDTKEDAKTIRELTHTIGQGLTGAFEKALSGQQSFLSAFGDFIKQLIEKIVAAAAAAAILAGLLALTGFSEVASFGSLFGTLSGLGSIGQHAEGGIFSQATVGMFGEAGPEAIVTPKHLQDFAGTSGGSQPIVIQPMMIGADLYYKQKVRSDKYIGRTS